MSLLSFFEGQPPRPDRCTNTTQCPLCTQKLTYSRVVSEHNETINMVRPVSIILTVKCVFVYQMKYCTKYCREHNCEMCEPKKTNKNNTR